MKYSIFKPVLTVLIAGLAFASCNVTSHTEAAAGVDFSQYKTFGWSNSEGTGATSRADNDIVDNNIKNSISAQLEKKGWVETDKNPEVLLDYTVAVKRGVTRETEPVYSTPYPRYMYHRRGLYSIWYPSMLMGYHTYNVPFREGELTVTMFDSKTNKLIWQGWAKGDINNHNITSKEATAQVKSIFKKFNYPNA